MKSLFFSIILLIGFSAVSQAARIDTSFKFSTIETPHFSIHFHQGLEPVARKAAIYAEEAHGKLVKGFSWEPGGKTEMVLIDDSDFANGLTTAIPYNIIYIQVVPPTLVSSLGEYDDWLKAIITHEYAHIVTLDPTRGYWKMARSLFGKPLPGLDPLSELLFFLTAPPNTFLPRWWHEGTATWAETEYTRAGRGKSSFYDMMLRMAVAEDNFPTIAQANGEFPDWPAGTLPYLFGYRLFSYISDTYGKDAPGKLNLAHAGRLPYLLGAPPQELFGGKNYQALYNDMIAALKLEQGERIRALSRIPFTPLRTVSAPDGLLTNPRHSPDGSRIAFTRHDAHDHIATVITGRSGSGVQAEFRRTYSEGNICWSPDGGTVYFNQSEINNGFNIYQDLYAYDLEHESITRLSHGQRLGEIDLSPDGTRFATVVSALGSQNLALFELSGKALAAPPRLVTDFALQRVSSPRWSPDGTTISYAVTDNAGMTALHLYDSAAGRDRTLFTATHTLAYPVWARDGSYLLYVSDETGVFNLFAYDLKEGKSRQLSHLLGGALQPDISPDGREIIFSSYHSRGFNIAQMTLDREKWPAAGFPSLKRSGQAPVPATAGVTGGGEEAPPALASSYNSLHTVLPTFWLPRISDDGSGTAVLGLFTAGADVLGYNAYSLTADYGQGRSRGYFTLDYQNDYFYPTLFLKAHAEPLLYANLLQRGNYYELDQGVTLGVSVPVNALESRYSFTAGYQLRDQRALSAVDSTGRFNGVYVFQGRRDNLFAGISFDSVLRYRSAISSEEGRRFSLLYRRFGSELGNDLELSEYSAEYQEFLRLPSAAMRHHILYLRIAGALADSSQAYAQQAFQTGGLPSELNPYPLRGYPSRLDTGKYVATGTLEYRAPLSFPMYGPGTLPFFAEKLHGALFVDAGEVWDDRPPVAANIKVGAGVEARMDVTLGYWLKVTPALGFAHGFSHGGENQIYLTVYVDL